MIQLLIIKIYQRLLQKNDQSEGNYNVNKEIRIKTSMLRSDLCDFSDAYIVVKGTITVTNPNNARRNKAVTFNIFNILMHNLSIASQKLME